MTETTQFRVLDFDCPTRASTVERALASTDGVDDVAVHYATGRVEITYDPTVADACTFETTIEKQGYTPRPA
ncbi:heavy metal-associated domain-containing protein [Haloarculaceae archaeon H-GB2-1]|nr:heavy metal-associated domain-containing protein [Haloarculaceae archaeon H-GB1-1]MEA5386658.1 heavy metal-associated domain-containing protein [Haloarculaceae archaeon H-GB11]MEA5408181.1 heavy metal-associated domain-containing protein [Haloarculaceae archaeon H-GB2-1]